MSICVVGRSKCTKAEWLSFKNNGLCARLVVTIEQVMQHNQIFRKACNAITLNFKNLSNMIRLGELMDDWKVEMIVSCEFINHFILYLDLHITSRVKWNHILSWSFSQCPRKGLPCKDWTAEPLRTLLSQGLILADQDASFISRDRLIPTTTNHEKKNVFVKRIGQNMTESWSLCVTWWQLGNIITTKKCFWTNYYVYFLLKNLFTAWNLRVCLLNQFKSL